MPADSLIERGHIVDAVYGNDAGDRIPLARVEQFLDHTSVRRAA